MENLDLGQCIIDLLSGYRDKYNIRCQNIILWRCGDRRAPDGGKYEFQVEIEMSGGIATIYIPDVALENGINYSSPEYNKSKLDLLVTKIKNIDVEGNYKLVCENDKVSIKPMKS